MPAEFVDALGQLAQPLEVQEVASGGGSQAVRRAGGVVGRAERHGSMAVIGQPHDDIRALAVSDTDDG